MKVDPFSGFHTNFNLESGLMTEPGWPNKEVILLRLTENLDEATKARVSVEVENGLTSVKIGGSFAYSLEGDILQESGEEVEFNEVIIEVDSLEKVKQLSEDFFRKNLGDFEMEESPLGGWFDPESRNEVLIKKAFEKALHEGLYNHLIPIIYTPFTKDVFQSGGLTECSPDIFRKVHKRKLKIA